MHMRWAMHARICRTVSALSSTSNAVPSKELALIHRCSSIWARSGLQLSPNLDVTCTQLSSKLSADSQSTTEYRSDLVWAKFRASWVLPYDVGAHTYEGMDAHKCIPTMPPAPYNTTTARLEESTACSTFACSSGRGVKEAGAGKLMRIWGMGRARSERTHAMRAACLRPS